MVIYPVVYVRDADTLYYETACGSGTTALGLTLAEQKGVSINDVPIIQPSGMLIKFSVDYDGDKFGYAQISGPIEQLEDQERWRNYNYFNLSFSLASFSQFRQNFFGFYPLGR